MRVATIGKGGSGKSFITGTLARILARSGERVLVLDSDPMPGVAVSLGMGPVNTDMLTDAVEQDGDGQWQLKRGIGPATAVRRFADQGPDGVRLLQYGKPDEEGMSRIRGSLTGFRRIVHRIASDGVLGGWTILGDLPAGTRQAAFNWAPYASTFLVVVEPTWQSILTAKRVSRIAMGRQPATIIVVANKTHGAQDVDFISRELHRTVATVVPDDDRVIEADRLGVAPLDSAPESPAVVAVTHLAAHLKETAAI